MNVTVDGGDAGIEGVGAVCTGGTFGPLCGRGFRAEAQTLVRWSTRSMTRSISLMRAVITLLAASRDKHVWRTHVAISTAAVIRRLLCMGHNISSVARVVG